ncbi:MAG TPA: pirin family protein [Alphaproteobacteria bacterium]|nr:pirin family protein [Alphaproteobacteria bacterium]
MLRPFRHNELGHANHGWLDSRFHFSFADYYDPKRMGFGRLRVINDDRIAAGQGFGMHPHQDMEIITYVREGVLAHRDSLGNHGETRAGDVQVMSAGTGIVHSEFSLPGGETTLFQIWIIPDEKGVQPRWEQAKFPKDFANDQLPLLVSGKKEANGALFIHSDAAIYGGKLRAGASLKQPVRRQAYVVMSRGTVTVNGVKLSEGDGAEVTDEKELVLQAQDDAELLVIDVG